MSSKQTIFCFGSNRNSICFGLLPKQKKNNNNFSVFRNKPKRKINTVLCNGHGRGRGLDMDKDIDANMDMDVGVDMDVDMDAGMDMDLTWK